MSTIRNWVLVFALYSPYFRLCSDAGEAVLNLEDVRLFDAFSVPNSFDSAHALGFVGATIGALRIHWRAVKRRASFSSAQGGFAGDFVETSATFSATVTTPASMPPFTPTPQHGFQLIAQPQTTDTHFAQIGRESNGSLFPG